MKRAILAAVILGMLLSASPAGAVVIKRKKKDVIQRAVLALHELGEVVAEVDYDAGIITTQKRLLEDQWTAVVGRKKERTISVRVIDVDGSSDVDIRVHTTTEQSFGLLFPIVSFSNTQALDEQGISGSITKRIE